MDVSRAKQFLTHHSAFILPLYAVLLTIMLTPFASFTRDIWTDESFSISYTAHNDLAAVLDDVRKNEETPPTYFITLWLWTRFVGRDILMIRLLSLIYGLLAAALFSLLARRWFPPRIAWLATTLMASTPLLVVYVGEARAYTFTLLMVLLCVLAFERFLQQPDRPLALILYALSAPLLFLSSYFGIALLAAHSLIWLEHLRRTPQAQRLRRIVQWGGVQMITALLIVPWLPSLLYQQQIAPAVTASWSQGIADYYLLALSLLSGNPPPGMLRVIWIVASATGWILAGVGIVRALPDYRGIVTRTCAVPLITLTVLMLVLQVSAPRYLFVLLPGVAIAVVLGYDALRQQRAPLAHTLLGVFLVGTLTCHVVGTLQRRYTDGWAALSQIVAQGADPASDVVLFHPPWDLRVFQYYYQGEPLPLLGAEHYDEFYAQQGHSILTSWRLEEALPEVQPYRRVWVFYNQTNYQVPPLAFPYQRLGHWQIGRLELLLLQVAPNT